MEVAPTNDGAWKRNLAILWAAQFIFILGISITLPFLPLFIQKELGVGDPRGAVFWAGLSSAAMGVAMFVSGPVWGIAGDRYGRKKMVLRALLGTMVLLTITGFVTNSSQLVIVRFFTGLFSGIVAPVMALATSMAPRNRTGFVVGVLMMAMFAGFTIGPIVGGVLAASAGFRSAYFISGGLMGLAGLLVLLMLRERFQRSPDMEIVSLSGYAKDFFSMVSTRAMFTALAIVFMGHTAFAMAQPVLPVFIESLSPQGSSAILSGVMFSIMGFSSTVAALVVARLTIRVNLRAILLVSATAGGVLYLSMQAVQHPYQVMLVVGVVSLFSGAMASAGGALIGATVVSGKHGRAFGASQSVTAMAFGMGPLLGGAIAQLLGLRSVFLFSAGASVMVAFVVWRFLSLRQQAGTEEAPVSVTVKKPAPQGGGTTSVGRFDDLDKP